MESKTVANNPADDDVVWPVASQGDCRNVRICHNRDVPLGNGVCVECWDKGSWKSRKRLLTAELGCSPSAEGSAVASSPSSHAEQSAEVPSQNGEIQRVAKEQAK
jgi:hypothetical protein